MNKETIYIDVEDDITSIVDKINESEAKVLALVPPKRSTVLGSLVNLKLINKSALDQSKRAVLITTDKTLISLAGGLGMYVAPNQNSAPSIPAVAPPSEEIPSEIIREGEATETKGFSLKKSKPAKGVIEDTDLPSDKPDSAIGENGEKSAKKKLKVPNFDIFKKKLLLAVVGGILLLVGGVWAFYLAPSAKVQIEGQTNRIATDTNFTIDTTLTEANFEARELPATSKEQAKEKSQSFVPTGEKNNGQKATGTVKIVNCSQDDTLAGTVRNVKSGTVVSRNGKNFITQTDVNVDPSNFVAGTCTKNKPSSSVAVVAEQPGDSYNLGASSSGTYDYSVTGKTTMSANGSAMGGGTNEIVKVVQQSDVDTAREAALTALRTGVQDALNAQFGEESYVLQPSFTESITGVTPSVPVGERADSAAVKVNATYFILGVKTDALTELLKTVQKPSLATNQAIFNTGLDSANVARTAAPAPNRQVFSLKTDAFAGPDVNFDELSRELAGMGFGAAKKRLEQLPGVTKAEIDLSPFWVFSMPRQADHIHIDIKVN